MPDADTAALLRAVLDEVCASVSRWDTRTHVASKLLETVKQALPPSRISERLVNSVAFAKNSLIEPGCTADASKHSGSDGRRR